MGTLNLRSFQTSIVTSDYKIFDLFLSKLQVLKSLWVKKEDKPWHSLAKPTQYLESKVFSII